MHQRLGDAPQVGVGVDGDDALGLGLGVVDIVAVVEDDGIVADGVHVEALGHVGHGVAGCLPACGLMVGAQDFEGLGGRLGGVELRAG